MTDIYDQWVATMQPIFASLESDNYQDMICVGQDMTEREDLSRWVKGDLACLIETKYGDDMIGDFAKDIGEKKSTLGNRRTLCRFWDHELSERLTLIQQCQNLHYTHYRVAMAYAKKIHPELNDQRQIAYEFLLEASDKDWTIDQAEFEVNKRLGKEPEYTKLDDMRGIAHVSAHALQFQVTEGDVSVIAPDCEYRIVVYAINEVAE